MEQGLKDKLLNLETALGRMGKCAVAFSGGVDSTFLLKVAQTVLGNNVVAVNAKGALYAGSETDEAVALAEAMGVRLVQIVSDPLADPNVRENPIDRCYFCKKRIFTQLKEYAASQGISSILDGSNLDDAGDFRPGSRAIKELGIRSPLKELGFTKAEIREASKFYGLPTWNKPSAACLASRIPYGTELTSERLQMVDRAERYLRSLGLQQLRVRHHEEVARIEVTSDAVGLALSHAGDIVSELKQVGYQYVTLDLSGYRTGSLNEVISAERRHDNG